MILFELKFRFSWLSQKHYCVESIEHRLQLSFFIILDDIFNTANTKKFFPLHEKGWKI